MGDYYYNTTNHHWKIGVSHIHPFQNATFDWTNGNITHSPTIPNIAWVGSLAGRALATRAVQNHDITKTYLFYNTNNSTMEMLDNDLYVVGTDEYSTYDLITILGGAGTGTTNTTSVMSYPELWFSADFDASSTLGVVGTEAIPADAEWLLINFGASAVGQQIGADSHWLRVSELPEGVDGVAVTNTNSIHLRDFPGGSAAGTGTARDLSLAQTAAGLLLIASDSQLEDMHPLTVFYSYEVNIGAPSTYRYFPVDSTGLAGTADAIELTTGRALAGLAGGDMMWFQVETDNTAAVTMAVDGIAAVDLKKIDSDGAYQDLAAGEITDGMPLLVAYDGEAGDFYIVHAPDATLTGQAEESSGVGVRNNLTLLYQWVTDDTTPADPDDVWDTANGEERIDFGDWDNEPATEPTTGTPVLWKARGGWSLNSSGSIVNRGWEIFATLDEQYAVHFEDSSTYTADLELTSRFVRSILPKGWGAWTALWHTGMTTGLSLFPTSQPTAHPVTLYPIIWILL